MKRIIYKNENGGVSIIIPSPEWLSNGKNTMEKLAIDLVPNGTSYKIIDVSEIPSDRTFRDAWEYQE